MTTILAGRWGSREFTLATGVAAGVGALLSPGGVRRRVLGALAGGGLCAGVSRSVLSRPAGSGGPADVVTVVRAALAGWAFAAALAPPTVCEGRRTWPVAVFGVPALALDAVDGAVARRTRTATDAGARLDMETDAAVLMMLSAVTARTLAGWTAGVGAARYLFVAGSLVRPCWAEELTPSRRRRTVAGLQGLTVSLGLLPVVPARVARRALAAGLAALTWSFAVDIVALERDARRGRGAPAVGAVT